MNVLYITVQNLRRPGGARSHVLGFCQGLEFLGAHVKLVSPYGSKEESSRESFPIFHRVLHLLRLIAVRREIVDCIKSGWPDVVYYRRGYVNPGMLTAFRSKRAKVFLEMNGILENESYNFVRHVVSKTSAWIDRYRFRKADLLVAVSDGLREHLLSTYTRIEPQKVIVVVNGVNTNVFFPRDRSECRKRLGIDPEAFLVVFAGKIAERHGLQTAVRAMGLLKKTQNGRAKLLIVGDGPAMKVAKKAVASTGMEESIHFTGMQPQTELGWYIGAADLCISPHSAWPTNSIGVSPLKIFEYLACDRPIVCSEVKGISGIVENLGNTARITLVPPDDPLALAEAIENAKKSGIKRFVEPGTIMEKISWKNRAGIVLEHMNRLTLGNSAIDRLEGFDLK